MLSGKTSVPGAGDALVEQHIVDCQVGCSIPAVPRSRIPGVRDVLGAGMVLQHQVIDFVQDHRRTFIWREVRQSVPVVVQPPVLIDGCRWNLPRLDWRQTQD